MTGKMRILPIDQFILTFNRNLIYVTSGSHGGNRYDENDRHAHVQMSRMRGSRKQKIARDFLTTANLRPIVARADFVHGW